MPSPRVDFYLLNTPHQEVTYRFLCRLVDKAYQQQHKIYIHATSHEETQRMDELLWTFRDISFIPHHIENGHFDNTITPVTIATHKPIHLTADILFNLTTEIPPFFSDFSRIIEIVSEEKTSKNQSRKKYKTYKEKTCQLTTHTITHP